MAESAKSSSRSFPDHGLAHDPPIDLHLPSNLRGGEIPLPHCLLQKCVFLLAVEIPHAVGMLDQIAVGVGGEVFGNTLEAVKEIPGVDLNEAVDADIPDVGLVAGQAIANVTVLLNFLTTWALIEFFADLYGDE